MLKTITLLKVFIISMILISCRNSKLYLKFVYDLPSTVDPIQTVTEVENWTVSLLYRKLVYLDSSGVIVNDLAESITREGDTLKIKLKKSQFDSSGRVLDSRTVKNCFNRLSQHSTSEYASNVLNVKELSRYHVELKLKENTKNFIRLLSSHLFSIYNMDRNDIIESGHYKVERREKNRLFFSRIKEKSKYPQNLLMLKAGDKKYNINSGYSFDTFLDYSTTYDSSEKLVYRVHENWGLVLNLKGAFNSLEKRKCLSRSIERKKIVENVLQSHKESHSLDNFFTENQKCKMSDSYRLLIPEEIRKMGEGICKVFNINSKVICSYLPFVELLEEIKAGRFDSALLSLTTDSPFLESNLDLLKVKSNFALVNKLVAIPPGLKSKSGKDFFREFEKFIFENRLFISISTPVRTVYASNIEEYAPSFVNPSNDSIENLIRE